MWEVFLGLSVYAVTPKHQVNSNDHSVQVDVVTQADLSQFYWSLPTTTLARIL